MVEEIISSISSKTLFTLLMFKSGRSSLRNLKARSIRNFSESKFFITL